MVATHGPWSYPRPVLWVRGSPLQSLPKPNLENGLSLDLQIDLRSVGQTTVHGSGSSIQITLRSLLDHHFSNISADVKAKKCLDPTLVELKETVLKNSVEAFSQGGDGILRIKKDIAGFVAKCPNCQQVKVDH
ncbi:hypothetical protein MTR67_027076 [Solanum verrucosum]|uniref:Uncharacterized protein n=1 Tax=Solanum verrucosum TaxID=315347 RepID=A0AAF0R1N4_SOLVR|nr:hypothetical protein MTR67_027076 [Solanum verrucosum]